MEVRFERFRREGDAGALAGVFDEVAPDLLRLARHIARRGDADDLVQSTFLLAIEKRESFEASRALRPWLTGILIRQAASARRRAAREVDPARLRERTSADPHDLAEAREISDAVAAALAQLSEADREVLTPLLLDGSRATEIARVLDRRPEAIHMRVHRGLARLRRLLPVGFVFALTPLARPAGLVRIRAAVLHHARLEFGLATDAAVPLSAVGVTMSIKKLGSVAVVVALALVSARLASIPRGVVGRGGEAPNVAVAPDVAAEIGVEARTSRVGAARSDARTSPAEAPNELELEVVRAGGAPAQGAVVALVLDGGPIITATLDERGRTKFVPGAGEADLYVRDAASFPYKVRVSLAPARMRVELPRGEELSGRLLERGGAPAVGVELELSTDIEIPGLGDVPFAELGLVDGNSRALDADTSTGDDGSFRFGGLPEGWSGHLELLGGRVFVEDGEPTALSFKWIAASGSDLRWVSAPLPRLTGRLLEAGSRRPLANHSLRARIGTRDGDSTSVSARTDAGGRFELALTGSSSAVSFELLSARDAAGRSSRPVEPIRWEGALDVRDLGEIEVELEPSRPLDFSVRGPGGEPVSGARVCLDTGVVAECDRTGCARLDAVPRSATRVSAVAPGHSVATVEIDAEDASPIDFVLRRTNELTVVLPEGIERRNLRLRVGSNVPLFGGADWMYPQQVRGQMVGHCLGASAARNGALGWVSFSFAASGRVVLEGLDVGETFRLDVEAEGEQVVFSADCEPMGIHEQRLVQVELSNDPLHGTRTVRGRVVNDRGRGLTNARVGEWLMTGLDGRFSLTAAVDGPNKIIVRKRGFASAILDLASEPANEVVIVLVPGRDVEVRVVDTRGRTCEDFLVVAQYEGVAEVVAERDASDRHFLFDLPARPVLVWTELFGETYSIRLDATERSARIEVPEHGRIEAFWSLPRDLPAGGRLRLALRLPGGQSLEAVDEPARTQVEGVLPHVLPGEYELVLEHCDSVANASCEYVSVHPPVRISVKTGATQQVVLN